MFDKVFVDKKLNIKNFSGFSPISCIFAFIQIIAAATKLVRMVVTPTKNVKPAPEIAFALPDITQTIPEPVSKVWIEID